MHFLLKRTLSFITVTLCITSAVLAQNISRQSNEIDLTNQYITDLNKISTTLLNRLSCLEKFHANFQAENIGSNVTELNNSCVDELEFESPQSAVNLSSNQKQLYNSYRKIINQFKQINDWFKEMQLLCKLTKEVSQKDIDRANETINSIKSAYNEIKYSILTFSTKIQNFPGKDSYNDRLLSQMKQLIALEANLLNSFRYEVGPNILTVHFPKDAILKNRNRIDSIIRWHAFQSKEPLYLQFNQQLLFDASNLKRYWINLYSNIDDSTDFSNRVITDLIKEYNDNTLAYYNQYVESSSKTNHLQALKIFPWLDKKPTKSFQNLNFDAAARDKDTSSESVSKQMYAVNSITEYVNHMANLLEKLPKICQRYNRSLLKSYEDYGTVRAFRFQIKTQPYSYESEAFFNLHYLPEHNRNEINRQLTLITTRYNDLTRLIAAFEENTQYQKKDRYNFQQTFELLREMADLIEELQSQRLAMKVKLNTLSKELISTYQKPNDSWNSLYENLNDVISESQNMLTASRIYLKEDSLSLGLNNELNQAVKELAHLEDNLSSDLNAPKHGTQNYKIKTAIKMIRMGVSRFSEAYQQLLNTSDDEKSNSKINSAFSEMVYQYNHYLVHYFNELVRMSDLQLGRSQYLNPYISYALSPFPLAMSSFDLYVFQKPSGGVLDKTEYNLQRTDELYESLEGYPSNHITLLIDVSTSMKSADKLPLLKSSLERLIGILRTEDKLSIITYSDKSKIILEAEESTSKKVLKRLNKLEVEGDTKITHGLEDALLIAQENTINGGNNRIILATDGQFTLPKKSKLAIESISRKGITLSVFYYGNVDFTPKVLKEMVKAGKGFFSPINTENSDYQLIREIKHQELTP